MENTSYVVVKSAFGDIWIGTVKLAPDNKKIFSDIEKAISRGIDFFIDRHCEEMEEIQNGTTENIELQDEYEAIINAESNKLDDATELAKFFV
jgi:hypothetical protein